MAVSKQRRQPLTTGKDRIGLLAAGSSGAWKIDIDETTIGVSRWFAQIEGPSAYIYFQIPSLDITGKALQFLADHGGERNSQATRNGTLTIGKDERASITLVRDDEFSDRYFLLVGPQDNPVVRLTLTGEDLRHIAEALRQVRNDLDNA
jgi:hypothetical protein